MSIFHTPDKVRAKLTELNIHFTETERLIGIRGNGVYHWYWKGDNITLFDHTYSQNTGRTKKGRRHGSKVSEGLIKKLGL